MHAQTDNDLTSLAASTQQQHERRESTAQGKNWKDGEGSKSGDALVLSKDDAAQHNDLNARWARSRF